MLIGNKKDKMRREVSYSEASQYARQKGFGFMEVSAKTGAGVREAFARLTHEVYREFTEELDELDECPEVLMDSKPMYRLSGREEIHKNSLVLD